MSGGLLDRRVGLAEAEHGEDHAVDQEQAADQRRMSNRSRRLARRAARRSRPARSAGSSGIFGQFDQSPRRRRAQRGRSGRARRWRAWTACGTRPAPPSDSASASLAMPWTSPCSSSIGFGCVNMRDDDASRPRRRRRPRSRPRTPPPAATRGRRCPSCSRSAPRRRRGCPRSRPQRPAHGVIRFQNMPMMNVANNGALKKREQQLDVIHDVVVTRGDQGGPDADRRCPLTVAIRPKRR